VPHAIRRGGARPDRRPRTRPVLTLTAVGIVGAGWIAPEVAVGATPQLVPGSIRVPLDAAHAPAEDGRPESGALSSGSVAAVAAGEDPAPEDASVRPGQGMPVATGVALGAYVETHWTYALGRPSNGIVAHRGFDNRHNAFTLSNVAAGVDVDRRRLHGSLWLQWGTTPATYYASEPEQPLGGAAGQSDATLWRVLQEAHGGLRTDVAPKLVFDVEAGLFTSPIGPESVPVDRNWNWSRSNLFFGLPFYHTGARANLVVADAWTITAAVYNGWNSVVDGNREKSVSGSVAHASRRVDASVLYFGGVERDPDFGARPWRSLFDAWVRVHATSWLALMGQLDGGFEPDAGNGRTAWVAGAGYVHFTPLDWLEISARGDGFREWVPRDDAGTRVESIFWPTAWVASGTGTLGLRPHEAVLLRIEFRHDHAAGPTYFRAWVPSDPATGLGRPNSRTQDTITVGAVLRL
jgi:hypothetical protein